MEKKDNLEYRKCTENKPFPVSISTANLERPKSGSYYKIYLYRQIEEESSFFLGRNGNGGAEISSGQYVFYIEINQKKKN